MASQPAEKLKTVGYYNFNKPTVGSFFFFPRRREYRGQSATIADGKCGLENENESD